MFLAALIPAFSPVGKENHPSAPGYTYGWICGCV